jgi:hypothetical protein
MAVEGARAPALAWLGRRRVVRALEVACLVALLASVPLAILAHAALALMLSIFAAFGAVIARRQPGNPIGGVLLLLTAASVLCVDAGQSAVLDYQLGYHLPFGRAAVFLAPGAWTSIVVLLPLPIALFPDGRLSTGWRRVLAAYLVACAALAITAAWQNSVGLLARHIQVNHDGELSSGNSPAAVATLYTFILVVYLGFCLVWVLRLLLAFRGARGPYRQQLKWLLVGGAVGIIGLALEFFLSNTNSNALHAIGNVGLGVSLVALPVAFGVAILKYRLYDIDRLISRTISYTILTGLLAAVFLTMVVVTTRVLPFSSPVGVAGSTLAAAALFNPLRRRIQHVVDRRFNRARYDLEAIVADFRKKLETATDLDTIAAILLATVDRSVQPTQLAVWLPATTAGPS